MNYAFIPTFVHVLARRLHVLHSKCARELEAHVLVEFGQKRHVVTDDSFYEFDLRLAPKSWEELYL